jgi:hypothetical protein
MPCGKVLATGIASVAFFSVRRAYVLAWGCLAVVSVIAIFTLAYNGGRQIGLETASTDRTLSVAAEVIHLVAVVEIISAV